ncbi:hypothetical protein Tco_1407240 [Tanacetum coccineum]
MAEQRGRGLKHLNHAVKSGSGETFYDIIPVTLLAFLNVAMFSARRKKAIAMELTGQDINWKSKCATQPLEYVSTINNSEFGRNINTPELVSVLLLTWFMVQKEEPLAIVENTNQNRGLTIDEGGNRARTQHENISTVSDRSTIVGVRADQTQIVVDKGKDVDKGVPRQWLKWLCLGWFAD